METYVGAVSQEGENAQVVQWRLDQFLLLGFDDDDALRLALSVADLHLTRSLIAAQCPHDLAVRIVT